MTDFAKTSAGGFFVGRLAVAVVLFAILGGWALVAANGMAQTCERNGGVWIAHDAPVQAGAVSQVRQIVTTASGTPTDTNEEGQ